MMASKHKLITIPRDNLDPFARYKRIQLISNYINTKGGQYIISKADITLLAHQLNRSAHDLISIIKKKLGININENKQSYIFKINDFDQNLLDDIIEEYIFTNVLCKQCSNPETELKTTKTKIRIS